MGHVGDVDLQKPAAIRAALDVHRVVKIAGGFAVNRDDRELAEILAAGEFCVAYRFGAMFGFFKNFSGKKMREVMLADDDFGVHAEIAGTPDNFDDASGGRSAGARIPEQLDVDHGPVKFIQTRDAPQASAGFIGAAETELLGQTGSQLLAARDFDFMLDSNVVRQDHIALRAVTK